MLPTWRLKLQDARRAYRGGQWNRAAQILQQKSLKEFLPAKKMADQLAEQLLQRADAHLARGDSQAGWFDLQQATQLGGCDESISKLRQQYFRRGLVRVIASLQHDEPQAAMDELNRMDRCQLDRQACRSYRLIARMLQQVNKQVSHGHFASAADTLNRAIRLVPTQSASEGWFARLVKVPLQGDMPGKSSLVSDANDSLRVVLEGREKKFRKKASQLKPMKLQLHQALSQEDWPKVLVTAEGMLELASKHTAALQAKKRAWRAVSLKSTLSYYPNQRLEYKRYRDKMPQDLARHESLTQLSRKKPMAEAMQNRPLPGRRMVAWIDSVGGYLICLGEEVSLGQMSPQGNVDIPLLADLSRRHALIRREGESYVLTPVNSVHVDGVKLTSPCRLKNQALIQLGRSVFVRFSRPHALSATAVLRLESHHRVEPSIDAIILMADNCILGPQVQSHVCCRHWPGDLVLVRHGEKIRAHTPLPLEVDGHPYDRESCIVGSGRLEHEMIGMSIEELS